VPSREVAATTRFTPAWLFAFATLGACLALLLIVHRATAAALLRDWARDPFAHGYFVAAAAAFLVWSRRERLLSLNPRPALAALPPLVLLSSLWLLGNLTGTEALQYVCLVATFPVLAWAVLGSAAMRALLFPAGLLFFALPFGDRIVPALQDITALLAVKMLTWSGVPALLTGHLISIGDGRWRVAEACGGINYLTASLAVGYVYAGVKYREWGHRMAFLLAAAVVPLAGNGLRVYTTILLDHFGASAVASGMEHDLYGVFVFATMTALLLMTCGHWREEPSTAVESSPVSPGASLAATFIDRRRTALCATAAMLLILSGPVSARILRVPPAEHDALRQNFSEISFPWRAVDGNPLEWSPRVATEPGGFLQTYTSGERVVRLSVPSSDATQPDLTLASTILDEEPWSSAAERHREVVLDGHSFQVLETVIRSPQTSLIVWTWYSINGSSTANPYVAKALIAKARLLRRAARCSTMAVATREEPGGEAVLTDFLAHLSLAPASRALAAQP
jgi:exosortase A